MFAISFYFLCLCLYLYLCCLHVLFVDWRGWGFGLVGFLGLFWRFYFDFVHVYHVLFRVCLRVQCFCLWALFVFIFIYCIKLSNLRLIYHIPITHNIHPHSPPINTHALPSPPQWQTSLNILYTFPLNLSIKMLYLRSHTINSLSFYTISLL